MRRGGKVLLSGVLAVMVVLAAAYTVMAQQQQVPDVITLKPPIWEKLTKSPVVFNHQKHAKDYQIACTQCHHTYKNGKNVWKEGDKVQPCWECHTEKTIRGEKRLPEAEQKLNLKLAFHNNCIDCHRLIKKQNPKADAPTSCNGCHPRKK